MNELHEAAARGDLEKMNQLIAADADSIKARHSDTAALPIAVAAKYGKLEAFDLLLSKGSPTDVLDNQEYPLIFYACIGGNIEIVKRLINLNHSLNVKGNYDDTVIHVAAVKGQTEMVKFLLTQGVSCFSRTKAGLTPLHCAASGNYIPTMKVLNEEGKLPYELLISVKNGKVTLFGGKEATKFVSQQLSLIEEPTSSNSQQPGAVPKVSTVPTKLATPTPVQNTARTVTPTTTVTTPGVKELQTTIQNQQRRIAELGQQVTELNKDKEELRKDKEDLRSTIRYLEAQLTSAQAQQQPAVEAPKAATAPRPSWAPNFHHSTSSTLPSIPSVFSHSIALLESKEFNKPTDKSTEKDGSHSGEKRLLENAETPQTKWQNTNS